MRTVEPRGRAARASAVDPVTFEILRSAFQTAVDLMAEQLLRTCHSFIIEARDFSAALCDNTGDTVAQGTQDVAVHVGTLHLTAKAVLEAFEGDIHPGDVFLMNDPYSGGTHFSDVRVIRPIFHEGMLVAFAQCNGHWADVGGRLPGSFDVTAREHFGEGLRIPPVRLWSRGTFLADVATLIASNTRNPQDVLGDLRAQSEATKVCEREIARLIERYSIETVLAAFSQTQRYVERIMRKRIAALPDGRWVAVDYMDMDPSRPEGLVPVRVELTILGDQVFYDLTGSAPEVGSFLNGTASSSFSGIIAGTKCFFPDVPLNSGFYRVIEVDFGPPGTVVNARWPTAVTGFFAGPYEKIVNAIFRLWSGIIPERAIAGSVNFEYLLVGGRDLRRQRPGLFSYYDWTPCGWGGRSGVDGASGVASVFGAGHSIQSIEAQERLSPILTTKCELITDSGGPGEFRGGLGVGKGARLTDTEAGVLSYCCDRARSVILGLNGGSPSSPQGLWLTAVDHDEFLGSRVSNLQVAPGDAFHRQSAGGGGHGDPLRRDPQRVLNDVLDGYVSIDRAALDYGVILREGGERHAQLDVVVDDAATTRRRSELAQARTPALDVPAGEVADRYLNGELHVYDVLRMYGVILDWGTGEVLPRSTERFRQLARDRAAHWTARKAVRR